MRRTFAIAIAGLSLLICAPARAGNTTTVEVTPILYDDTNADLGAAPGQRTTDAIEMAYAIQQPLSRRFFALYSHGYSNHGANRVFAGSRAVQSGITFDAKDVVQLSYSGVRSTLLSLGYYSRRRICCPAANDPLTAQPRAWTKYFVSALYGFGRRNRLGPAFSYEFTYTFGPHRVNDAARRAELAAHVTDEGSKSYVGGQALSATLPVDPSGRTLAFSKYVYAGADYYDNTAEPVLLNVWDYGLRRIVNDRFMLSGYIEQTDGHRQGYPFAFPQAPHGTQLIVTATLRYPGGFLRRGRP